MVEDPSRLGKLEADLLDDSLSSCLPHPYHLLGPPSLGWNQPGKTRSQFVANILLTDTHRSRGSGKGKESEYENGESDCPDDEEVPLHFFHDH